MRFEIHPSVGVARLGNSPDGFYLEPETTGGRPVECSPSGDPILEGGRPVPVEKFKDESGRIKRQASRFRVYVYDTASPNGREIVIGKDVKSLEWTVHLANKKAVWYGFEELVGDLMVPPPPGHKPPLADNSYKSWGADLRNADTKGEQLPQTDHRPRATIAIEAGHACGILPRYDPQELQVRSLSRSSRPRATHHDAGEHDPRQSRAVAGARRHSVGPVGIARSPVSPEPIRGTTISPMVPFAAN